MQIIKLNKNTLYSLTIIIVILLGVYFCFVGGYGSDEDTLPMIYVFEARLSDGRFVSSRFTSYPIPEIGIGFLSHFFGSWAANLITFIFHLIGLVIIYLSFENKFNFQKIIFFLILALSSPVLYFENLEPMDYSWAFLFLSLGTFFYSKKLFEIAILAFAFSVGCRLNFIIFILVIIFFFNHSFSLKFNKRLIHAICTFIISGLFYLPVWFDNGFDFSWITSARPIEQGFFGLFARFTYKTWLAFGFLQTFVLIFYFFKFFKTKKNIKEINLFLILIISNLILFLYIPAELSYLQPAIIFTYLMFMKFYNIKIIAILIFLNFLNWGVNFQILKIDYKDNSKCAPKHAISANFDFALAKGALQNFVESRKMIGCWIDDSTERGKRILEGKSTRIP